MLFSTGGTSQARREETALAKRAVNFLRILPGTNDATEIFATKLSFVSLVIFAMVVAMSGIIVTGRCESMVVRMLRIMVVNVLGLIIIFGRTD
jgi:hypothetical protein